jgi:hypothetical protein
MDGVSTSPVLDTDRPPCQNRFEFARPPSRHARLSGGTAVPVTPQETPMSGPIVRTGTTPKFWENYDKIFSGAKGKKASASGKTSAKPAKKKAVAKKAGKK